MAKPKIEVDDWLTLHVKVTKIRDGEVTVQLPNGNRETVRVDSQDIIEITPERKQARKRGLFDGEH